MNPFLKKWLIVTAFTPIFSLAFALLAVLMLGFPLLALIWPDLLLPLEDTHERK